MGQVSSKLRRGTCYYSHWCPGCEEMHVIYVAAPARITWSFGGDIQRPSFSPSVRITAHKGSVCHYFLTSGELRYCTDSTHRLAGTNVPLPDLPEHVRDDRWHDG